jgi:glycosyltransferase involved in cell wall biosynthesis
MSSLVSVIIPTYKGSDVICRAVNSVINQTYNDVEIIVVDDNGRGTEEQIATEKALSTYIRDNQVIYIPHESNRNGSAARNTGAKVAKGKYLTLLDDDDEYYPDKVKIEVEQIEKLGDEYALVWCSNDIYDSNGKRIYSNHVSGNGHNLKSILMHDHAAIIGSDSLLIKTNCYREIGGFDESFLRHQDYEFTTRVAQKWKVFAIDKPGVKYYKTYRNSPKSIEKEINYRLYFLKKMMPIIDTFRLNEKKSIVLINIVGLFYYDEIKRGHFFSAYNKCRELCKEWISINFIDFLFACFHIFKDNIKVHYREWMYK